MSQKRHKLFVIGAGPGAENYLTPIASEKLREAACVVVAPRHRHLIKDHANIISLENFNAALDQLAYELTKGDAAVLVSGDPGIYSLLPILKRRFSSSDSKTCEIQVIPGLSSLQCLCAEAAETWTDAVILSGHGRELAVPHLLNTIERNRLTIIFCDATHSPLWVCEALANAVGGLGERVEIVIGERLSAPDQRVTRGRPDDLVNFAQFDALSIVLVRNEAPWTFFARPRDENFIRGDVPMTRSEVRSAILDHLSLTPDAIVWDIGAGTGSVSVAAALACAESGGEVHAVEFVPAALELLECNREKFHVHNMKIYSGRALALLDKLPRPTHVFIGGSGGELEKILEHIARLGQDRDQDGENIRVVVSAVTLDTLSAAVRILRSWQNFEAVQIAVSKSRLIGSGRADCAGRSILMAAQNPVTLLSAEI